MGDAVKGLGARGGGRCGCGGTPGSGKAASVKKPPVFIGLGAVYNRNLNTLLGTENPLAFLRIG